jgi:hypothetical protein
MFFARVALYELVTRVPQVFQAVRAVSQQLPHDLSAVHRRAFFLRRGWRMNLRSLRTMADVNVRLTSFVNASISVSRARTSRSDTGRSRCKKNLSVVPSLKRIVLTRIVICVRAGFL